MRGFLFGSFRFILQSPWQEWPAQELSSSVQSCLLEIPENIYKPHQSPLRMNHQFSSLPTSHLLSTYLRFQFLYKYSISSKSSFTHLSHIHPLRPPASLYFTSCLSPNHPLRPLQYNVTSHTHRADTFREHTRTAPSHTANRHTHTPPR